MEPLAALEEALMARLTVLTSRLPFPPREGHQLRSWHLIDALCERHEVTLLSFVRGDDTPDETGPLRARLKHLETFPIPAEHSRLALGQAVARGVLTSTPFLAAKYSSPALRARLAHHARTSDLVHFDMLPLMGLADCVPAGVPVVLNAHNVEHALLETRAGIEARPLVRRFLAGQVPRLHAFEQAACRRADAVLACSDPDALALRALAPDTPVRVVPNGVDLDSNRPEAHPGGDTLVFVGQMGWFPNRDGVDWFLRDVFPRILAHRPRTRFVVVGKPAGLEVPEAVASQVTLTGFVPDLRPHVHAAAVYVVPLRAGSGTRLKVLEAMALGKAIVTTHVGSEGIELQDGRSALYADDAERFAHHVIDLLDNPARAAALGHEARERAEARYGWRAIGHDLLTFYDTLLGRPQPVTHTEAALA